MIREPRLLLFLLGAIPLGWIAWKRYRAALPGILSIAGGVTREVSNLYLVRWFFTNLSFLLALAFLLFAASGVRWGREAPTARPSDVDVVLAFDVSRSMLATDIRPTRLERSVAVARTLVDQHRGTPFGIVVFKGEGVVFLPVTDDATAIGSYLDMIDGSVLTSPGTNLESGLLTAAAAFPTGRDARSVAVLFTDGGFLEGNPRRGAEVIAERGIDLIVVGTGRSDPVPIPTDGGYVTDAEGNRVLTALRSDVLGTVGEVSEGTTIRIDDGNLIDRIGERISGAAGIGTGGSRDRFRLLLTVGLAFLAIWLTLRTVRWRSLF